ncbi:glycosyltransferase [Patescibacteria group bacterium]|nr:glycosyltransferase [Patescibacteria group bacterium]MBU1963957.1 glycosyltransferase [Patescibacteria group bacterium]
MRISIILTTYNNQEEVGECLESLLDQTIAPFEIIVVDDGSNDDTISVASQYPVRIIKANHLGRSYARNLGWKKAKGEVICFAEADSVYNRKWLENIRLAFFQGADAVIPELRCYYIETYLQKCLNADYRIRFFKYTPFSAWAYKKEVLAETGGYNEFLEQAEERDLGNRLIENGYKIKVAKGAIQYHKGEPKNYKDLAKRSFNSERKRTRGYLMINPHEKDWKKLFILLFFFLLIPTIILFPFLWPVLPGLLLLYYLLILLKVGFKQRGFWIVKMRYGFGIAFYRLTRSFLLAAGFMLGELDKIFAPQKIYTNISSLNIASSEFMDKQDMRVSVVIPTLNEEKNIEACLRSLKKQTYSPLEIIMVDDSSTDKTIEIGLKYGIKILKTKRIGKNACRNVGWKYANGNIIVFATAKSVYAYDWLENYIEPLQYFDAALDRREVFSPKTFYAKCQQVNLMADYSHIKPKSAWAYRRSILEETKGFDEALDVAAEKDLGSRILRNNHTIGFAPEAIQYYKGLPYSLGQSFSMGMQNSRNRINYAAKNPKDFAYVRIMFVVFLAGIIFTQLFFYQEYLSAFLTFFISISVLYILIFIQQAIIKNGWKTTNKKRYLFGLSAIRLVENFAFISGSVSGK